MDDEPARWSRPLLPGVGVEDRELDADQQRLTKPLRKAVQNASVSASPTSIERISRHRRVTSVNCLNYDRAELNAAGVSSFGCAESDRMAMSS
jgi:hypothetical protein